MCWFYLMFLRDSCAMAHLESEREKHTTPEDERKDCFHCLQWAVESNQNHDFKPPSKKAKKVAGLFRRDETKFLVSQTVCVNAEKAKKCGKDRKN